MAYILGASSGVTNKANTTNEVGGLAEILTPLDAHTTAKIRLSISIISSHGSLRLLLIYLASQVPFLLLYTWKGESEGV